MPPGLEQYAFLLEFAVAVIAGVWVIATIRSTTRELTTTVKALGSSVDKLEQTVEKIDTRVMQHEVRLALLERADEIS